MEQRSGYFRSGADNHRGEPDGKTGFLGLAGRIAEADKMRTTRFDAGHDLRDGGVAVLGQRRWPTTTAATVDAVSELRSAGMVAGAATRRVSEAGPLSE